MKVFLGGTCNNSNWREEVIKGINIDYFNPVVDDWNDEAYEKEIYEKEHCDLCLYIITPRMTGVYSIAEVVDDSNKRPDKTIFCFVNEDVDENSSYFLTKGQRKSLVAVGKMVEKNGAVWLSSIVQCIDYLNKRGLSEN